MSQKALNNCMKVISAFVFLLFFQFSYAQKKKEIVSPYDFADLTRKLDQYQKQLGKDMVVMVYKDSQVVYEKNYGDMDKRTQANIGASSQWLTAALVMQFIEEGKFTLESNVVDYISIFGPYFKKFINIRHCLTHLTGIEYKGNIVNNGKYESLDEEAKTYAKKEIESNPGLQFKFNVVGLNLAARIAEISSRKSFDQLIATKLLRLLNMRATTFYGDNGINPSGGAQSTAQDYLNFLAMLLNKGKFNGKQVLSEATVAAMEKEQVTADLIKYAPAVAQGYTYGYGNWIMEKDKDGNGTAVSCPGVTGMYPFIDYCKKYACVILVKNDGEQKKEIYQDIKRTIDNIIPGECANN